ncbi:hypothetical protein Agabi119p4_9984 [Agaricus bisporus var. burnettii]|uniref:Transposase family Tnp2 protein n=1 Tax=Agaricus bisporus var. burnettii TaxID=192524 RepID=A0A8H7C481_AGABI|nr:hypothetical protein Agabi119p4_9984 [Agaricus bisporus var. burnettii]
MNIDPDDPTLPHFPFTHHSSPPPDDATNPEYKILDAVPNPNSNPNMVLLLNPSFATRTIPKPPESNNATSLPLTFENVDITSILQSDPSNRSEHELKLSIQYNQNPPTEYIDLEEDFNSKLSLDLYLALQTYPEAVYTKVTTILNRALPSTLSLLSLYRIKRFARKFSYTSTIEHDMCPNSCIAFTGPLDCEDTCYECGTLRWDPAVTDKKVATAKFSTITLGTQLQSFYASSEVARLMQYRWEKTQPILAQIQRGEDIQFDVYDDIFSGYDYAHLVKSGTVDGNTILLMLSIDGAQLYEHRASDCWMLIWVILELSPALRYKKRYVLPAGIIPGPGKPKNLDTFLFPGLYHISALQREGLRVWDAALNSVVSKRPQIFLDTADAPGMASISGIIGYKGARGCRNYCTLKTRHTQGASHYYPILQKLDGNMPAGSDHPNINLHATNPYYSQTEYNLNVTQLLNSFHGNFNMHRKLTGLTKPSIFSGLYAPALGAPGAFPIDTMHLFALNIPELLLHLWRGTLHSDRSDPSSLWPWRVLVGEDWKQHGAKVAALRPYLPYTYTRPPRNPAEKIHSGYKADEFNGYTWGYLPGLLYGLLPEPYYQNFCKLVRIIHLMSQRQILPNDLDEVQKLVVDFLNEYEEIYIDHKQSRIHFVRQCLHTLWHLAPETCRLGPPALYAQWTMERTIGNLGQEIRLHSNPYANLTQRAVARGVANSIYARYPDLWSDQPDFPRGAVVLSDGYALLHPHEDPPSKMQIDEYNALSRFVALHPGVLQPEKITRSARLQLPNGVRIRCAWKEDQRRQKLRVSRMVKLKLIDQQFKTPSIVGEVLYFFCVDDSTVGVRHALAMISLTTAFDQEIRSGTHDVLWVCGFTRYESLLVVNVDCIDSLVALLPLSDGEYFLMEDLGNSVATSLAGSTNDDNEADEGN